MLNVPLLRRAAAIIVCAAFAVLIVPQPAAAQAGFSLDATCPHDGTAFTATFEWRSDETGTVTFEVRFTNPDSSGGLLFRASGIPASNSTQALRRTVLEDGAVLTWTWTHSSGTQTGTLDCAIPPPPDATLNDLEATLTEIHAELEIVDSRLTNINRNVQLTTTNVQDVENLLTATNATLALMANELGPRLESLRVTNAELVAQGDGQSLALDTISYRLRETDAVANQLRNQTHALLALVALMFALWLRPIFRSRKQAT